MKPTKYNFRRKENKEKAVYKLVMYPREGSGIKGSYINSKGNRVAVIYGYYNKLDFGLQMLRNMVHRNKGKLNLAMIYAKPNLNPNHTDFSEIIEKFTS
jgi:hypothetical protein